jgi:PPK2 family polyphosphate:nucleotide phosphotransferase
MSNPLVNTDDFRVRPGKKVALDKLPSRYEGPVEKEQGKQAFIDLMPRMQELQEKLYAEGRRSLLIVLQAMDAAGKDSTVRHVFEQINPAGCHVTSFKAPSSNELAHDYLWRVHQACPGRGMIGVFNRSHYEEVLIVRVKGFAPKTVWKKRYDHINCFEKLLSDEGTVIRKFYLHISKDYQKQQLQERLDEPHKHWKFNPADLAERAHWDDYMHAFEDAMQRCSTEHAPWYVVPAERKWYRDLLIAQVIVETLEQMDPQVPKVTFDSKSIVIA